MSKTSWTTVAIPTLGESPYLQQLLDDLLEQEGFDELIVMDDRPIEVAVAMDFLHQPRVAIWHRSRWEGRGFYATWNEAWHHAARRGAQFNCASQVVLLNDDISIPPYFVERLVKALRSDDDCWCAYPDWRLGLHSDDVARFVDQIKPVVLTPTQGTYKHGGMWGCAFALKAEILNDPLPPIDEQFAIWAGDDDLVKQIDLAGKKTCRVEGLALEHHASTTWNQHPELHDVGWADVEKFKAKYGEDAW